MFKFASASLKKEASMKFEVPPRLWVFIAVLLTYPALSRAENQAQSNQPSVESKVVVERGRDYQVCLDKSLSKYTEVRPGMHFLENGQWVKTEEKMWFNNDGSAQALKGPHKIALAKSLSEQRPIQVVTANGVRIWATPSLIQYTDDSSGARIVLGEVQNCRAEQLSDNKVIYRNAFQGIDADFIITYASDHIESDVVIRTLPKSPEAMGLNPQATRLQVVTVFESRHKPQTQTKRIPALLYGGTAARTFQDTTVVFDDLQLGRGTAFLQDFAFPHGEVPLGERKLAVAKEWVDGERESYLVESIPYSEALSQLSQLPANTNSASRNQHGFVIDWIAVSGNGSFTFSSGQTYWIDTTGYFGGSVSFQGGAVIKYTRNRSLLVYGPTSFSNNDLPVVFTGVDDSSVGEPLTGSEATGTYASQAFWSYYVDKSVMISRCEFKYCNQAVRFDANTGVSATHTVQDCKFSNCSTAVHALTVPSSVSVNLINPIFGNSSSNISGNVNVVNPVYGTLPISAISTTASFIGLTSGSSLSGTTIVQATGTGTYPLIGGRLYVDGVEVDADGNYGSNGVFSFALDTTAFASGSHRLSIALSDNGDIGTTGDDPTVRNSIAQYGVKTIQVNFVNNILSNARLEYNNFLPQAGQTQKIYGTWSSSRQWRVDVTADGDPTTVLKSFSGNSSAILVNWNGNDSTGAQVQPAVYNYVIYDLGPTGQTPYAPPRLIKNLRNPIGPLGVYAILYQGHHPSKFHSSYPTPGNITFAIDGAIGGTSMGPWGRLAAPSTIAKDLSINFPNHGYYPGPLTPIGYKANDAVVPADLIPEFLGGSGVLDNADLGLFIGHSAQSYNVITGLGSRLSYVPIYNKAADTMTYVDELSMYLGGPYLKWMAFYSCNLLRDGAYRQYGDYSRIKHNVSGVGLPINPSLHILQAYATEVTVSPLMGAVWLRALTGKNTDPTSWTVVGAWNRVCRKTQPKNESSMDENVARSVYWPECAGDYIVGYGPSTTPNPDNLQIDLVEEDEFPTP